MVNFLSGGGGTFASVFGETFSIIGYMTSFAFNYFFSVAVSILTASTCFSTFGVDCRTTLESFLTSLRSLLTPRGDAGDLITSFSATDLSVSCFYI